MALPPKDSSRTRLNHQTRQDSDDSIEELVSHSISALMIPSLFTSPPLIQDLLETATSEIQDETVEVCRPFLTGEDDSSEYNAHGVPSLDRHRHVKFLHISLGKLPGRFVGADASRPWFLYWCLHGLTILGEDISGYRDGLIATARSIQNISGGFGGGSGQFSHLATTYATILALAIMGGEDAYQVIDRRALWEWLCSLKQPDGGFQVCLGGEEDIR